MISKREIGAKIAHLEKFQNLAKSIQMIAIANVHKLNSYISSRDFSLSLFSEIYSTWLISFSHSSTYNYTFVIITSEKNCCGKLNSDIVRAVNAQLDYFLDISKQLKIISIGWRSRRALSKYVSYFNRSFVRIGRVSFILSYAIGLSVFYSYFDVCRIVFSKYNKVFEQIPCCYDLVSYNMCYNALLQNRQASFIAELILSSINDLDIDFYQFYFCNVCVVILDALFDHMYSEFGCRAYSMEMSYANASELLKETVLVYNKYRQWSITAELLDLIAGTLDV